MAGRPRSIDNTKVFDVAKPSNAKPMGTSRPVIVNHAAPIKDPTVITVTGIEDAPTKLSAPSASRRVISPINVSDASPEQVQVAETAEVETIKSTPETNPPTAPLIIKTKSSLTSQREANELKAANATKDAQKQEPETVEPEAQPVDMLPDASESDATMETKSEETVLESPETVEPAATEDNIEKTEEPMAVKTAVEGTKSATENETAETDESKQEAAESNGETGSDAASVDALAEASGKTKEQQQKADEQAKRDAALQDLIDSKKYFVPLAHDSSQKSSSSMTWVVLLILIIAVAGGYAAIDAKVIKTGINLPLHLFKQ